MGPKPFPRATVDRRDPDGSYSPDNCRWATQQEQCRNKRGNRRITHGGRTMTVGEWAEEVGLPYGTLLQRVAAGWSAERALTEPYNLTGPRLAKAA